MLHACIVQNHPFLALVVEANKISNHSVQVNRSCRTGADEGVSRVSSAGLMPTEARGNYLPEAPYLRETKTYVLRQLSLASLRGLLIEYQLRLG